VGTNAWLIDILVDEAKEAGITPIGEANPGAKALLLAQ
jgi:hypothetical protein